MSISVESKTLPLALDTKDLLSPKSLLDTLSCFIALMKTPKRNAEGEEGLSVLTVSEGQFMVIGPMFSSSGSQTS